jgi:hypothetical protein
MSTALTTSSRLDQLEKLVAHLHQRIADLEGDHWVTTGIARKALFISRATIIYRITNHPDVYPEGIVWRWNGTGKSRLINLPEWRRAQGTWNEIRYTRNQEDL